ncbi:MAG: glycosyl transferase family protein [Parcubacteria group bacterium Gr01-1014_38]|nr:MAG: glycosyl transferase family protein [Parcubacteria group bacterium Gr01-1014_38]
MENLSAEFVAAVSRKTRTRLIANRHGKKALPWFLPWAAFQMTRMAPQADVIHLGDPLLTLLLLARLGLQKPVTVTVHGLDVLYPSPLYQALLRRSFPRVSLAFCISHFVEQRVRERFPAVKTTVLSPGQRGSCAVPGATRAGLARALERSIPTGPLLLAIARLVRRKGLAWFVERVLPQVPSAMLLIIGDGPERQRIAESARRAGVPERVLLAGTVPRETLNMAYTVSDLLVMPNIPVPGDAEGFGLVALEAASAGLPVIAADLEGIPDAVIPNETGILVPPQDATAWVAALTRLLRDSMTRQQLANRAPKAIRERFSWEQRGDVILETFTRLSRHRP